jgi:hypothetical protein
MSLLNKLREIRRLGASSKAALSHFLRLGPMVFRKPGRRQFVVHPRSLGLPEGLSYDNVQELIKALESFRPK